MTPLEASLISKDVARSALGFYSTAFFRRLAGETTRSLAVAEVQAFLREIGVSSSATSLNQFYSALYKSLKASYRVEVVYKEAVLNWWLNRSGNRSSCGVLYELRVGRSKVDAVCVGRFATAFEIKTRYDSPARLADQLGNYRTRFPKVYVVIPDDSFSRFEPHVPEGVGIVGMTRTGRLATLRECLADSSRLIPRDMLSLLRSGEIKGMLESFGFDLRGVPNTKFLREASALASTIDRQDLARSVASQLRSRTYRLNVSSLRSLALGIRSLVVGAGIAESDLPLLATMLEQPLGS